MKPFLPIFLHVLISDIKIGLEWSDRQLAGSIIYFFTSLIRSLRVAYPKQKKVLQEILSVLPSKSSFVREKSCEVEGTPPVSSLLTQSHSYTQVLPFIRKLEYGQTREGKCNKYKKGVTFTCQTKFCFINFVDVLTFCR